MANIYNLIEQIIELEDSFMEFMISMRGSVDEQIYLNEIATLGSGIELGSYGLIGVKSQEEWDLKFKDHKKIAEIFNGKKAIHGPFIGMDYTHMDYLIRSAVQERMDMTYSVAIELGVIRVILHSGHGLNNDVFHLNDEWLSQNIDYWKNEISRWEKAGIEIVLENETESSPDLLIQLVETVNSKSLNLCLDIGHSHYLSSLSTTEWIKKMGSFLKHIHIHDNDQKADRHWSIGKGNFDFDEFYKAVEENLSEVTLTIEVGGSMQERINDLKKVINRFEK